MNELSNLDIMLAIVEGEVYQCEVCIGKAAWAAGKSGHSYLFFCNHHLRQHQPELVKQGWIIDEL